QVGTIHAIRNLAPGSVREREMAGAAGAARIAPGKNVSQNRTREVPGGAPCDSRPPPRLAKRAWPNDFVKKVMPLFATMAANHGSASTRIHAMPAAGFRRSSHAAERSTTTSVKAHKPTNSRISGPLMSTPPAIAVQKIAGRRQG